MAAAPAMARAPTRSLRPFPRPATGGTATTGLRAANPDALISAAQLGGRVTYAVYDGRSGALLEERGANTAQPPASVAKAITALYALDRLGPGFRYHTRVVATGPVQGGVVQGDLMLLGAGDPTLETDQLGDLAAALRARGVGAITGRFLIHAGALPHIPRIDAGQPDYVGYNPAISGLNLNFNRVHFEWKRGQTGWQASMDARGKRFVPLVRLAEMRIADRQAPLFTYERRGEREHWTVASGALGKGGSRWLPVRLPERYAAEVFQTLCAAQGLRLPEPVMTNARPGGTVLAEVTSQPLPRLLRDMLHFSTNITAEAIGLTASGANSLAASTRAMGDWLRERHGQQIAFADHSGLSGGSRVTAAAMAGTLLRNPQLAELMRPFATRPKKSPPGPQVLAKTGTLNFVSGLGGFVPGSRPLVFAIFAADTARRDALHGAARDRPAGGREWIQRARALQGQLIEHWVAAYGA